jgi:hypothetical protein
MRIKFKFKFVLTTINYCVFCLFRFCKTVFNFKFKLILRKKKMYVNNFLTDFQQRLFISSTKISSLLGNYVTIRRTRHTGRVRLRRTRSGIQWITAFSLDSGQSLRAFRNDRTETPAGPAFVPAI